ncbi:hypothetical protein NY78_2934 [Desulfovibrio sp. TomC]|nr:hypothetical protein NY78_2934 [Desulfovibrio sp. TomC]
MQRHCVVINGVEDDPQNNSRRDGDNQNQLKHDSQFNGAHETSFSLAVLTQDCFPGPR